MASKVKQDPKLLKAATRVAAAQPKTSSALISLFKSVFLPLLPTILGEVLKGDGKRKYRSALLVAKRVLDEAGLDDPQD